VLTIAKEFHFSASHVLRGLPPGHPCGRTHGHNYVLSLELSASRSALDDVGFVRDYRDLDTVKRWVDETLDHVHLNDVTGLGNPTSENIACWVFDQWSSRLPELSAVRLSETPRTWAEYRPARGPA
jgi:6-pyruvoyltetrahydropterin/6-carboxytetrahydropterin synthase